MTISIKKIKHYEIIEPIGKGGMGEVYLALDTILDRKVAIKFLPEETQQDHTSRERFIREAKSAAALDHPFICKIYEAGEIDGKAYIVMEYLEGEDLGQRLKKNPLPLRDSLNVALEIAEALEKAHKNNIVHRDLKPGNIMITPQGHVKVMDFGLAKKVIPGGVDGIAKTISQAPLTEQGMIAGTLAYMSPEQARGEDVDPRSDIFSLGIILQEMLSGMHPFTKTSAIETLSAILRDPAPYPNIKPKMMNPILSPILKRALAKNPNDRYQNISDIAQDIRKAQREIIGGVSFSHRVLPITAASIVVIALLIFTLLKFTRQVKVPPTESTPEPISVIIADVQNQTGDAVFDGVLEKLLSISLDGASYISVYDRKQAIEKTMQLKPGSEGKLDIETAQLLSRREGINAVISASIKQNSNGYLLKSWALDATSSNKIAEVSQHIGSKTDILKVADLLSAKLRVELGLISPDSTEALIKETFTTTSLEAMNAYARAQELDDYGKPDEALKEYLRAIDNDPNFGRAYAGLAVIYYNQGQYQNAKNYYQEAMKRIDQMTDREKYRTRGGYYLMIRDFNKAIEEYSALVEQHPKDYSGHANLALAYFFARNMQRSVEEGRIDVQLNPQSINGHYNLAWYALGAGNFQMAEKEMRSIVASNPDFVEVYVCLGLAQIAQNQIVQATETYRKLETINSFGHTLATTGLADLAVYEGRLTDAINILVKEITFDLENKRPYNAADKSIILANVYLLQDNKSLAAQATDQAISASTREEILLSAALIYLKADKVSEAREIAGKLSKQLYSEPLAYAKLVGGELSMGRGDISSAIRLFQEAQSLVDTWLGHFLLGCAYLDGKAFTEAYSEFETCIKRQGEAASVFLNDLPSFRYLPPVYYYLGRAQEGLGSDAATASYQKFLQIKEKNEGDWMVKDARRRFSIR